MCYYKSITACENQQKLNPNQVYGTKGWGFELLMARQNRPKSEDFGLFLYASFYKSPLFSLTSTASSRPSHRKQPGTALVRPETEHKSPVE